jgi:hypothetical protein
VQAEANKGKSGEQLTADGSKMSVRDACDHTTRGAVTTRDVKSWCRKLAGRSFRFRRELVVRRRSGAARLPPAAGRPGKRCAPGAQAAAGDTPGAPGRKPAWRQSGSGAAWSGDGGSSMA